MPQIQEKIKSFECLRCHECCRQPGYVYLASGESERMASFLGMDIYDFTETYCDLKSRHFLVLKKQTDEACIFLTPEGCRIHPVKPKQCRDFPVSWRTQRSFDYCAGIKKQLG